MSLKTIGPIAIPHAAGSEFVSIDLPGRPRWCVTDAAAGRIFLCIREPSMVLVARLPDLGDVAHWKVPSAGAHGAERH